MSISCQQQNHLNTLTSLLESDKNLFIKQYQLMPYNIKFKKPWHSAASKLFFRQGFLLKLIINESIFAIGECAPMLEIGTESLAQAQQFLGDKLPSLLGKPISLNLLSDMSLFPACRFALETALLSTIAQHKKTDLVSLLSNEKSVNNETVKQIYVNAMLGSLNNDLLSNAQQAESQGFKCLKIKVGLNEIKAEAKALTHLFQQLLPTTLIRLDANKSWSVKETQWLLNFLKPYESKIDSIEEPLKNYDQAAYQDLQNKTTIALALDESFPSNSFKPTNSLESANSLGPANSLEQAISIDQYPVKQLVLKPMAHGGIINTLHLARQAQESKIKTVITSSIETAYGLWPIVHLCAAINNKQFHGLATSAWLEDTLIEPPEINHGIITL